jgi:transposase
MTGLPHLRPWQEPPHAHRSRGPADVDLDRLLPPDHLARQIDAACDRLDLTPLYRRYGGTGSDPWPPALLLRAVLYETRRGPALPADWHRDATEALPVRWLLRGCTPARSVGYAFRDRLGPALDELHRQVLALAQDQQLTPATRGALDGTAVAAHASRHRLLNEDTLRQRAAVLAAALPTPAVPPAPAGPAPQATAAAVPGAVPRPAAAAPAWLAATARGRQQQQRRLQRAQTERARRQQRHARKRASKRQKRERIVVSLSDPEAALGRDKQGVYRPLDNVQVLDDLDSPFVLAYDVFARPNDAGALGPLLGRAHQALGHGLEALLADTAYAGGADRACAQAAGVTVYAPRPQEAAGPYLAKGAFTWEAATHSYVCPQGQRLAYEGTSTHQRSGTEAVRLQRYRCPPAPCQACPLRQRCTKNPAAGRTISRSEHEGLIEALRARMQAAQAKELYRLRRQTVELVNADGKEHRQVWRFSGRGLARARCQVGLTVLAHNLVTLLSEEAKARARPAPP